MLRAVFACLVLFVSGVSLADVTTDFRDKVKSLVDRYQDLDKRAVEVISKPGNFAKYAEIRNELIRFVAEPRREISQARAVAEQYSSQRIQTEQELKVLLAELEIDLTDEDNKPVPFSALVPRIEDAITKARADLETETKSQQDIQRERSAKSAKQRNTETPAEEKQALAVEIAKLATDFSRGRDNVRSLRSKGENLRKAKDLLTKSIDFTTFSARFVPEIERLEILESKASQKIQQVDETIFNFLLIESNDKRYTLYSTLVFGVAVVIVIGSFFFVAYKSEAIRASIFANDSGLQFVTLFSLVIAIILFGVLKILEGKELAALLGGLSGYILGRGGITRQPPPTGAANQPAPPATTPPAPATG